MRELYRSEHLLITVDDDRRLVRRTRTERGFASIEEIDKTYQGAIRVLDAIDRSRHVLLVDVRLAPPRNDPAFEQAIGSYQPGLYGGFRRLAIVIKTEAGRLQIGRLLQARSIGVRTFMDEASALAYLLDPAQPDRRP